MRKKKKISSEHQLAQTNINSNIHQQVHAQKTFHILHSVVDTAQGKNVLLKILTK